MFTELLIDYPKKILRKQIIHKIIPFYIAVNNVIKDSTFLHKNRISHRLSKKKKKKTLPKPITYPQKNHFSTPLKFIYLHGILSEIKFLAYYVKKKKEKKV